MNVRSAISHGQGGGVGWVNLSSNLVAALALLVCLHEMGMLMDQWSKRHPILATLLVLLLATGCCAMIINLCFLVGACYVR